VKLDLRTIIALALLYFALRGGLPNTVTVSGPVTYVYEKDSGGVPSPVAASISKLNQRGIIATVFEQNSVDGMNEVPDQYKVPLAAAKEAGLPSLVVQSGTKVLRVIKDPRTEEDMQKAVP
jgi:hypothetical protein